MDVINMELFLIKLVYLIKINNNKNTTHHEVTFYRFILKNLQCEVKEGWLLWLVFMSTTKGKFNKPYRASMFLHFQPLNSVNGIQIQPSDG